jgi:hypothetical protein
MLLLRNSNKLRTKICVYLFEGIEELLKQKNYIAKIQGKMKMKKGKWNLRLLFPRAVF